MSTKIQIRRDTASNWTSVNPVLLSGELGIEFDTLKVKIGSASLNWNSLPYISQTWTVATASVATSASYALSASFAPTILPGGVVSSSAQAASWTVATASVATSASTALLWQFPYANRWGFYEIFTDMDDIPPTQTGYSAGVWGYSWSGTGAAAAAFSGTIDRPGIRILNTGTVSNGFSGIRSSQFSLCHGGGKQFYFRGAMRVPTLSDATNRYIAGAGFIDSIAGVGADGAAFLYEEAVSPNWRCWISNNSVSSTFTTNTAVNISTWYTLEIQMTGSAASPSASFFVNGALVAILSGTNMPSGIDRVFGCGAFIAKTAGTTARTIEVDYLYAKVELDGSR